MFLEIDFNRKYQVDVLYNYKVLKKFEFNLLWKMIKGIFNNNTDRLSFIVKTKKKKYIVARINMYI